MGRLTTHVLDTARGRPGAGITIELYAVREERRFLTTATTDQDGRCPRPLLEGSAMAAGHFFPEEKPEETADELVRFFS